MAPFSPHKSRSRWKGSAGPIKPTGRDKCPIASLCAHLAGIAIVGRKLRQNVTLGVSLCCSQIANIVNNQCWHVPRLCIGMKRWLAEKLDELIELLKLVHQRIK